MRLTLVMEMDDGITVASSSSPKPKEIGTRLFHIYMTKSVQGLLIKNYIKINHEQTRRDISNADRFTKALDSLRRPVQGAEPASMQQRRHPKRVHRKIRKD